MYVPTNGKAFFSLTSTFFVIYYSVTKYSKTKCSEIKKHAIIFHDFVDQEFEQGSDG